MTDAPPTLDPELLERLRRGVPLRLTAAGAFEFGGEPVTHGRVGEALRHGLDRSDSGDFIVRLGTQWCYLTVDDCPFRVRGVASDERGKALTLLLDDGRNVELDRDSLHEEPDRGLWCVVPSRTGRPMPARFSNPAAVELSDWVIDDVTADLPALRVAGLETPIRSAAARPPSSPPSKGEPT